MSSRQKEKKERVELEKYLSRLLLGFETVEDAELPLITDVFSMVEYALVTGEALPIGGEERLRRCRDLLKQAITDVILGDYLAKWEDGNPDHTREKVVLKKLVDWIDRKKRMVGLVTTNYDIGIDHELYKRHGRARAGKEDVYRIVDLGFDWRHVGKQDVCTRPRDPQVRVYKLHGSLDTLVCRACGYVYFNPQGSIVHQAFREALDDDNTCICRDDLRLELHIVSPSLVRDIRDANLLGVWRSALEWMRTSDRWIIVGYSLPPEDLAVRSLLLRAYHGASSKPEITVVQNGNQEQARYRVLFPDCRYETNGLEGFLDGAAQAL